MSTPDRNAPLSIPRAIGVALGAFAAYSFGLELISLAVELPFIMVLRALGAGSSLLNEAIGTIATVFAILATAGVCWWYLARHAKQRTRQAVLSQIKHWFKPRQLVAIVLLAFGVIAISTVFEEGLAYLAPGLYDSFEELMSETDDMGIAYAIFYVCLIGPIGEEVTYRGIAQHVLMRSRLPIWAVIIIQSVLFGVMHLIPFQIIYATLIGLILGYICYYTRSVVPGIIIHVINNTVSTIVGAIPMTYSAYWIMIAVMALAGLVGLLLIVRGVLSISPTKEGE